MVEEMTGDLDVLSQQPVIVLAAVVFGLDARHLTIPILSTIFGMWNVHGLIGAHKRFQNSYLVSCTSPHKLSPQR
jgi:hypothetical protein